MASKHQLPSSFCDLGVGLTWTGERLQDLDLQALVVNRDGAIIEAAYYNNAKALRGAVVHSGDSLDGKMEGIDEKVLVHVERLPVEVLCVVFMVCNHSGNPLSTAGCPRFEVFDETEDERQSVYTQTLGTHATASVSIPAVLALEASGWSLFTLAHYIDHGAKHFMDCLPETVEVVKLFVPHAQNPGKLAFSMRKGCVFDFSSQQTAVFCGLGWDTHFGQIDLDASCVVLDPEGNLIDTAFFSNLKILKGAIKHSGDNLTGEGAGDDEVITVDLERLPEAVHHIYFIINIYTINKTFKNVANPYCRVCDAASGVELCNYMLTECPDKSALIIGRMTRERGGRWAFTALGQPSKGSMWRDTLPEMKALLSVKPHDLWRAQTTAYGRAASNINNFTPSRTITERSHDVYRHREESTSSAKCCPLS